MCVVDSTSISLNGTQSVFRGKGVSKLRFRYHTWYYSVSTIFSLSTDVGTYYDWQDTIMHVTLEILSDVDVQTRLRCNWAMGLNKWPLNVPRVSIWSSARITKKSLSRLRILKRLTRQQRLWYNDVIVVMRSYGGMRSYGFICFDTSVLVCAWSVGCIVGLQGVLNCRSSRNDNIKRKGMLRVSVEHGCTRIIFISFKR